MTLFELRTKVRNLRGQVEAARSDAERRGWAVTAATLRALEREINALENEIILAKVIA